LQFKSAIEQSHCTWLD